MSFEESYEERGKNRILQRAIMNSEGELHLLFSGRYPSWTIFSRSEVEQIRRCLSGK